MTFKTHNLDGVVMGEESTQGVAATVFDIVTFGHINNFTYTPEDNVLQVKGIRGGASQHIYSKNVDLLHTITGSITFMPIDLKFLQYVAGGYAEATDYTVTSTKLVPTSLTAKANYDNTNLMQIRGIVLSNLKLAVTDESIVSVTCDWVGYTEEKLTGQVTYVEPTVEPLTYLDTVFKFGTQEWNLSSVNISIAGGIGSKRGIASIVPGSKRIIKQIYRSGVYAPSLDGVGNIEDADDEIDLYNGGTTPQDVRVDVDVTITFSDNTSKVHTLTVTDVRLNKFALVSDDADDTTKQFTFNGVGKDTTAVGDL